MSYPGHSSGELTSYKIDRSLPQNETRPIQHRRPPNARDEIGDKDRIPSDLVQTDYVEDTKANLAPPSEAEASSLFMIGRGFLG
ncbi:hypothetical protein BC629DRAFT_1551377 [Irpex lacteus]|nr:hypothetical protein BC629DRAFT_1551377 [Irpex lacteus]